MKTDQELREDYLKAEFEELRVDTDFATFQLTVGVCGRTKHFNIEMYKLDALLDLMLADLIKEV